MSSRFGAAGWSGWRRRSSAAVEPVGAVASTQDALYRRIDLDLSWSERDLPERERTKHVHRLHPYLGKFIPQLVEALLCAPPAWRRPSARPVRGLRTTLVQALESGHDATGVDVAPFNCLLMRVKTREYNPFVLESRASGRAGAARAFERRRPAGPVSRFVRDWFAPRRRPSCSSSARSSRTSSTPTCSGSCSLGPRAPRGGPRTSTSTSRGRRRRADWCHKHRRSAARSERRRHVPAPLRARHARARQRVRARARARPGGGGAARRRARARLRRPVSTASSPRRRTRA